MSCAYVQWRIPEEALTSSGWSHHPLLDRYEKRLHNKGVIIQRPEFESLQVEWPWLASRAEEIPCGKCIQCRLARSRDWANRCMLELKTSQNAYFITLTYDDSQLSFNPFVDPDTAEVSIMPCLVPKQLQDFLKRVRFWCSRFPGYKNQQRFYACGEYGESTQRPHYHLIIYNLPPEFENGNHLWSYSAADTPLWTSKPLSKLWPHGLAVYGQVNWSSCAYVARYCMKKRLGRSRQDQQKAQQELFPDQPWPEEFTRMSLRPAIGKEYYLQNRERIYQTDEVFVNIKDQIQAVKPSKYYDRLYDVDNPYHLKKIKSDRKRVAKMQHADIMSQTDLTSEEYALMKERSKEEQARKLIRPSI